MPDLSRYHRQMLLPGFGEAGQKRLLGAKVFVVGCGALGTVIANMLARAGVGRLVIIDRDFIELTNLQRQVLFDEQDVADAIPKAEAAKQKIAKINSQVKVTAIVDDLNHANIEKYVLEDEGGPCNLLIDGVDNFETRFLVNDVAVKHGIPYVYGGAVGTVGMTYAILPHTAAQAASSSQRAASSSRGEIVAPDRGGDAAAREGSCASAWERAGYATPCLRCIFEQAPPPGMNPTCETAGVLGPVVSIIANYEVNEALKILTGNFDKVNRAMVHVDVWENQFRQFRVAQAYEVSECPCCKGGQFEFLAGKFSSATTTLCGRNAVQLTQRAGEGKLNFDEIAQRLRPHGSVTASRFMIRAEIRDNGQAYELTLFTDGRAIVKGTKESSVAKSIYAKYVGA